MICSRAVLCLGLYYNVRDQHFKQLYRKTRLLFIYLLANYIFLPTRSMSHVAMSRRVGLDKLHRVKTWAGVYWAVDLPKTLPLELGILWRAFNNSSCLNFIVLYGTRPLWPWAHSADASTFCAFWRIIVNDPPAPVCALIDWGLCLQVFHKLQNSIYATLGIGLTRRMFDKGVRYQSSFITQWHAGPW